MRLPCVVTAVGGAPEQIEEGRSGYLIDYPDREALVDRFRRLLADPEGAAEMGQAARRRVVERFSSEAMLGAMQGLYVKLLGAKQGGR